MPRSVIPVTGLVLGPIGTISQTDFPLISPRQVNPTDTNNLAFGETFVLNANNTYSSVKQYIASNSVAALLALLNGTPSCPIGIAKDAVETNGYYPLNGGTNMPAGYYAPGMMVNGLTRGTISAQINNGGAANAGTPVYMRLVANGSIPAGVLGGLESTSDQVATTGTASSGSTALTVASGTGIQVGQAVTGAGIAPNTTVAAVSGTSVTLSQNTTAALSGTAVTFANSVQLQNIVFKTGVISTDPNTGKSAAQVTILERKVA
ncbi:hypothetical protein DYQ86_16130 [Acidobacteria bacterium AB60]|nr:hypothetical protein DYQ86_16130 [Acidobacteria bacterium AB60]